MSLSFLKVWPGGKILLVWGIKSFDSVLSQATPIDGLKNVVVIPWSKKTTKIQTICDLYGGEPILIVNAQNYTYEEMASLSRDLFGRERMVCVTPEFPYWHHTFKIEEKPFGFFNVKKDKSALHSFCTFCFKKSNTPLMASIRCKHPICEECQLAVFSVCLHANHKKELEISKQTIQNDMNYTYCMRNGCEALVDTTVFCSVCREGGFCCNLCLLLVHECSFMIQ
jgi:hypothetical protein